jgi:hypothetical protein
MATQELEHNNETEGDEVELDKVIVPNTGSSGGSYSGPHHRKFVCSSSGGAKTYATNSQDRSSELLYDV